MAQPQRLNELLSGWQVDPALVSMQQAKAAEELTAALRKAEAEYENFTAKGKAARAEATEGFKSASEGMMTLFRGLAMFSASSQKDLEKIVQTLAKFEAGVNVVKGIGSAVHGSAKAWEAYREALLAAASAEAAAARVRASAGAAGTAAQAVGGAGLVTDGGGIILGSATATLGAFVAAVAGAAFGLKVFSEQFDGSAKRLDSWTAKIGAAEASAATAFTSNKDRWWYKFMRNDFVTGAAISVRAAEHVAEDSAAIQAKTDRLAKAGDLRDQTAIEQAHMQAEADERRTFQQGWADQLRSSRNALAIHRAGAGLEGTAQGQAQAEKAVALNNQALEGSTVHTRVALLGQAVQLQRELESATKADIQSKLAAAKESLSLHKQELQTVQQRMQALQSERAGALTNLAHLDPVQARTLRETIDKARGGDKLTLQEAERLRKTGLSEFMPVIQATEERRVGALGLLDAIKPVNDAIRESANREQTLTARIELEEKLTLELKKDETNIVAQVGKQIEAFLVERDKAARAAYRETMQSEDVKARAREAQERRSQST